MFKSCSKNATNKAKQYLNINLYPLLLLRVQVGKLKKSYFLFTKLVIVLIAVLPQSVIVCYSKALDWYYLVSVEFLLCA